RTRRPKPSARPRPRVTPARPVGPRAEVVRLANLRRVRNGCPPLREDPRLTRAAQRHSDDMAARGVLSHTGRDGRDPGARITAAGYRWSAWAENVQQGAPAPASVTASWMGDAPHRANILTCRYTEVGVGYAAGPGGPWWTQDLAAPG
ncbi:CAP domain-containing protein, partial [Actinomadura roseirufa]|uniref:CAP domain-containing protein n=1 Tax=Actinomadura roseirufa TaxID=2094049 RepID=UPI0010410AE3